MNTKEDEIDLIYFLLETITFKIKLIAYQVIVSEWNVTCESKICYSIILTIWQHLFLKNYHLFFYKNWWQF